MQTTVVKPPAAAAWLPVVVGLGGGLWLLHQASR